MSTMTAERFVEAIAAQDAAALLSTLDSSVDFKALTPGRLWEASSSAEVLDVVLGAWFPPADHVDALLNQSAGEPVGDLSRISYRFALTTDDGPRLVEQQLYYREQDGQLTYLRIMCSGFRDAS